MDFKCFMKLLIEKGYIREKNSFDVGAPESRMIVIDYKCKYKEVRDRIASEIDKWHSIGKLGCIEYEKRAEGIKIINKDNLEKYILDEFVDEEEFYFATYQHFNGIAINLERLFKYSFLDCDFRDFGSFMIRNTYLINKRIEKEEKEKEECLDFLSKLP